MNIQDIKKFFAIAVPTPTEVNYRVQLGCHFEEFSEQLENMPAFLGLMERVRNHADLLKQHNIADVTVVNPIEELDALCDQIVTAIGTAHMKGYDIVGALDEVNRSNFSKFDENGNPIFDENGKIKKNKATYFRPDLSKYIGVRPW